MMVYVCDRCGKIIPRPEKENPTRYIMCYGKADYDDPADGGVLTQIELCKSCYDSLIQWQKRWTEDN